MPGPVLKSQSLFKSFTAAEGRLPVLQDIELSVSAGEFLCIIGPSGCGKTTLLELLGGLQIPDQGTVLLGDHQLNAPHPDIGIVFQKPNLMPWRTVLENVLLPLKISKISKSKAHHLATDALEKVGLSDFLSAYPKALSGGMEQRVSIARALVQQPRILLLDEPFGALDALSRDRLNTELLQLWRQHNFTAVMVTHNIYEAVHLADRILVLSPRPATISAEFKNKLPRPRPQSIEFSHDFIDLAYEIRQAIKE